MCWEFCVNCSTAYFSQPFFPLVYFISLTELTAMESAFGSFAASPFLPVAWTKNDLFFFETICFIFLRSLPLSELKLSDIFTSCWAVEWGGGLTGHTVSNPYVWKKAKIAWLHRGRMLAYLQTASAIAVLSLIAGVGFLGFCLISFHKVLLSLLMLSCSLQAQDEWNGQWLPKKPWDVLWRDDRSKRAT